MTLGHGQMETGLAGPASAPGAALSDWQRFIARLVAHGPVNTLVPGSILQTARTDYTLLGGVADNVVISMGGQQCENSITSVW